MRSIAMTLHPFRLLLPCSSITSQNSEKNKIRAKVQVLTKTQSLLEQAGLEKGTRCKSASVTHPAISAVARPGFVGPMASGEALPSVRQSWWRRVQICLDDVLHYLFHRGCPFVLEQNVGWRDSDLGRLRVVASHATARHLSKEGGLVQKVDDRGCEFQFRPRPWPSHARRGGTGVREAFCGSSLQVHVSTAARLGQGSAAMCLLLPEAVQAPRLCDEDVRRSPRTQSRCPRTRRPHWDRRQVPPRRSVRTNRCQGGGSRSRSPEMSGHGSLRRALNRRSSSHRWKHWRFWLR